MTPGLGTPPKPDKKIPTPKDYFAAGTFWLEDHPQVGWLVLLLLAPGLALTALIGKLVYRDV